MYKFTRWKEKKVNAAKHIKVLRKNIMIEYMNTTSLQDKKKKGKCSFTNKLLEKKI